MRNSTPPARPRASGFTLTEVIVALGLFVFAITGLMGVIPAGMSQVQTASNESRALAEMESIRDDVRLAIGSRMKSSLRYRITPPAAATTVPVDYKLSEDGEIVTGNGPALYRVIGTIRAPAAASADPVYLHLRATWPAKAPAGKEAGSVELISAFKS
jgi:Tfp pilus assembly protein PilV